MVLDTVQNAKSGFHLILQKCAAKFAILYYAINPQTSLSNNEQMQQQDILLDISSSRSLFEFEIEFLKFLIIRRIPFLYRCLF
jgi:hypothetical protein